MKRLILALALLIPLFATGASTVDTVGGGGVPSRGTTELDDFALAAASAPIGAGYDFASGTDTDRWVFDDAMRLCRSDGQWDVGAHEYGAAACY